MPHLVSLTPERVSAAASVALGFSLDFSQGHVMPDHRLSENSVLKIPHKPDLFILESTISSLPGPSLPVLSFLS